MHHQAKTIRFQFLIKDSLEGSGSFPFALDLLFFHVSPLPGCHRRRGIVRTAQKTAKATSGEEDMPSSESKPQGSICLLCKVPLRSSGFLPVACHQCLLLSLQRPNEKRRLGIREVPKNLSCGALRPCVLLVQKATTR